MIIEKEKLYMYTYQLDLNQYGIILHFTKDDVSSKKKYKKAISTQILSAREQLKDQHDLALTKLSDQEVINLIDELVMNKTPTINSSLKTNEMVFDLNQIECGLLSSVEQEDSMKFAAVLSILNSEGLTLPQMEVLCARLHAPSKDIRAILNKASQVFWDAKESFLIILDETNEKTD